MGDYYKYKCNKCDYEESFSVGGGFFTEEYWEETKVAKEKFKDDVIGGVYGEQLKNIINADICNFSFTCNDELLQCPKCRQFSIVRNPEIRHYTRGHLYELNVKFPIKCPKCSYDEMIKPDYKTFCPKCKNGEVEMVSFGNWD